MHPVTRRLAALTVALFAALAVAGPLSAAAAQPAPGTVLTTQVRGAITPVIADHLDWLVDHAEQVGAEAVVVQLDTPGGLVASMRKIVQAFLRSEVPVVVHVEPRGADAGSAGTYITMAAHVAAMAPATTIGAATPVDLEGGEVGDKIVENAAAYAEAIATERGRDVEFAVDAVREGRSITVTEAVEIGAVDLQAADLEDLLAAIDGLEVELPGDRVQVLATADAPVEARELSGVRNLLQRLADPNLAFIFLSIATLAIVYEVASPGLGAGGIVGVVLIVLAMFSLSVLPVNYAGAALIVLAGFLFTIELFVPGVGVAAAGGAIALALGGLFLFQRPTGLGLDLAVVLPTALLLLVFGVLAGRLAQRTMRGKVRDASHDLVGREGTIELRGDQPRLRMDGTFWSVEADAPLADGQLVVVTAIDGLTLRVAPADAGTAEAGAAGAPADGAAPDDATPAT